MDKRFVVQHFPVVVRLVEDVLVKMSNWSKREPVFIYQFGKVGSSTVYQSIKQSGIKNPLYHTHYLTPEGVASAVKFHSESGDPVIPHHLILSRILARRLQRENGVNFKVITLVRDPIERAISSAFENIYRNSSRFVSGRSIDLTGMAKNLTERLSSSTGPIEWLEHWLDTEMKVVTGIDLLDAPFDAERGWSITSNDQVSVLTIKIEKLTDIFSEALSEFFEVPPASVSLVNTNVGEKKWYADDYKAFKKIFALPSDIAQKAYSSRYVQTFYPDKVNEVA